jgi:hypothetical protein
MKYILAIFVLFFMALPSEARHLAVFCMDNPIFTPMWNDKHPDVMVKAKDWRYLDQFLKETQNKFNNDSEELVIEIDCHGCAEDGLLYIDERNFTSMGSVIKRVEEFLPDRPNMTLIFECCYAGRCYKLSSRGDKTGALPGGITTAPWFPVLGISDEYPNYGNLQYLEYINHDNTFQMDIRAYEIRSLSKEYYKVNWEFIITIGQLLENLFQKLNSLHTI